MKRRQPDRRAAATGRTQIAVYDNDARNCWKAWDETLFFRLSLVARHESSAGGGLGLRFRLVESRAGPLAETVIELSALVAHSLDNFRRCGHWHVCWQWLVDECRLPNRRTGASRFRLHRDWSAPPRITLTVRCLKWRQRVSSHHVPKTTPADDDESYRQWDRASRRESDQAAANTNTHDDDQAHAKRRMLEQCVRRDTRQTESLADLATQLDYSDIALLKQWHETLESLCSTGSIRYGYYNNYIIAILILPFPICQTLPTPCPGAY